MPLKLPILSRKHTTSVDDPKDSHFSETTASYPQDLRYTHSAHNRTTSESSSHPAALSHKAPGSVLGSTSTVPSSAGPRTPPPMSVQPDSNSNSFFDQPVFDPPMPNYMKSAASGEHPVDVFPSPKLAAPSAAAFVSTRSSSRQDLSWPEQMSPSANGYFGGAASSPVGQQVAKSDDEFAPFGARHARNDSAGYFYGNGNSGRLETSTSSQSIDKMLQKSPEQQLQGHMSTVNLSDDDGEESDESFAERNRRSEAELMRKGAEELKRRSTVEASKLSRVLVPGSPEDAKVELPSEVVSYLKQAENQPAPSPGLLTREKRVMTVSEFEKYRRTQADSLKSNGDDDDDDDEKDPDSESENEGFFRSDSDSEIQQEALRLKQRQDANLAVYRQQMRKVTGNLAPPPPPPPPHPVSVLSPRPNGQLSPLSSSSQLVTDPDDEDDEVPLGILQAHGLPGRHRGAPASIAPRPMSARSVSIYPNQIPVQNFPSVPPSVSIPRGLTLPEQMHDPTFDPQFHQPLPAPRGLIHEIAREQEAKLHRRSMLNMHMQTGVPYDVRPASPFHPGTMPYPLQPPPPASYMYPPSPQLLPTQHATQPPMQPPMQPDASGISPDLQLQMQKFLGLQMQMMRQMLQSDEQLPSPPPPPAAPDVIRRIPSPANSIRGSTYYPPTMPAAGNLPGQAPVAMSSTAANPARYRTLSTQHSFTNLNYQSEAGPPSVRDSRYSQDYAHSSNSHEHHRLGSTVTAPAVDTIRVVDNNKELAPALPIRSPLSSAASVDRSYPPPDEPYDGSGEDDESKEWERLRRQKSTLRKAWKQRRSVNVSTLDSASTSETGAAAET
ncbi:hypothetical protein V1509DRAFT_629155 [Lipomyces kononenkoae]